MSNLTTSSRLKYLRELMPLVNIEVLRELAELILHPITVIVTTCSTSKDGERKRNQCRLLYQAPFFILKFAHASSDKINDISTKESFKYPNRLAGNLLKIRQHVEDTHFIEDGFLVISDDDPGSSYNNGEYQPQFPRSIFPDIVNISSSGAKRISVTPEQLSLIWHIVFYLGRKNNCAYVGLNGSAQTLSTIPGYETTGAQPNRSFGTYGFRPIQTGVAITGAAGVVQPLRKNAPKFISEIKQEWAAISAMAISEGFNTLMFMPVQATFAVKPPKDAAEDINTLAKIFKNIVRSGNSAGGDKEKTGCIIKFLTAKHLEV